MGPYVSVFAFFIASYIFLYTDARQKKIPIQPIKLFVMPFASQGRAVIMAAKALGVPIEVKTASDELEKTLEPYYKINMEKSFPIMDDSGFILWESHVIMTYFANAYAQQNHYLYPENPRLRAQVDNELMFDLRYVQFMFNIAFLQKFDEETMNTTLRHSFDMFEFYLEGLDFVAGENLTLVDISILPTINDLFEFGYDFSPYVKILKWFDRTKKALIPFGYEEVELVGARAMSSFMNQVKAEGFPEKTTTKKL